MKKVLVDTSIWIEYFKGNKDIQNIIHSIKEYQCFITGPVISELLLGIKTSEEKDRLITCLNVLPMLDISNNDWIGAGNTGNLLRRKGITVPLIDLVIFSVANNNNCAVFTMDRHFSIIRDAVGSGVEIMTPPQQVTS